jgi:hypothetical protein
MGEKFKVPTKVIFVKCKSTMPQQREIYIFYYLAQQPPVGQGLLIHRVSRSHTHNEAPQSVGLLWKSDQPEAETST